MSTKMHVLSAKFKMVTNVIKKRHTKRRGDGKSLKKT